MGRRVEVLELAVLGVLQETAAHGYEIRKRLNTRIGTFRTLSYGTLYPTLKALVTKGWIEEVGQSAPSEVTATPLSGRRARTVYQVTAAGKDHFQNLMTAAGPEAWEDDAFDVHFAFFARTDAATRLRILEGRRTRLYERRAAAREAVARNRDRRDNYTLELQRHGLDSVEREVRWLDELIDHERTHDNPGE